MVPAARLSEASPAVAILTGPTASGKTDAALRLAGSTPGIEIVNADSVLVYRGFDIGSAKPTAEERSRVPHHLIDIRDPSDTYTAAIFVEDVERALAGIHARGGRALIVGGSGFYLKALLFGLWPGPTPDPAARAELEAMATEDLIRELHASDPEAALRIGGRDRYRLVRAVEIVRLTGETPTELEKRAPKTPDPRFRLLVIDRPRAELEARLRVRATRMLEEGLVAETRALRERHPNARPLGSVGYAQVCRFLDGAAPEGRKVAPGEAGLAEEIALATRQLVKAQRTWFRSRPEARFFELDRELPLLESAFREVYP